MLSKTLKVSAAMGLTALLAAGAAPAAKDAPAPERELRAAVDQFAAGWNDANAKTMAAVFTEDADLVNPFGRSAKGRAGIEKFFADEQTTLTKGTRFAVTAFAARMVRPDVAIEDVEVEIGGGTMAPDPAKPLHHHAFVVARKQGSSWLIVSLRAYSILPPPQPPSTPPK
jgi:uncharacterized protein (TIGR02246 family)